MSHYFKTLVLFLFIIMLTGCVVLPRDKAYKYYSQGTNEYGQGQKEAALASYQTAIDADPTYVWSWISRGTLYWDAGEYTKAYEDFLNAGKQPMARDGLRAFTVGINTFYRPTNVASHAAHRAALVFYDKGQYEEADVWWQKAYSAYPWQEFIHRMGDSRIKANKISQAFESLDQWIEHSPRYGPYKESLGLSVFHDNRYDLVNTEESAGAKAEGEGNFLLAFQHYGKAYALLKPDYEEDRGKLLTDCLIRAYQKCSPKPKLFESARRYIVQAKVHVEAGRDADAITTYRKVSEIAPWYPAGFFNQALLYGKLGSVAAETGNGNKEENFSKAIFWMKRYLEIAPDAANVRTAQDRIYEWEAQGGRDAEDAQSSKGWVGAQCIQDAGAVKIDALIVNTGAERSGLQVGDRIIFFGNEKIETLDGLYQIIYNRKKGDLVSIVVDRDGKQHTLWMILDSYPAETKVKVWLGVALYQAGTRTIIDRVESRSPAYKAGFKVGDVLLTFDGQPITSTQDFVKKVQYSNAGDKVSITVERYGEEHTLTPVLVLSI
ncbi:MAG: PDZ domain-containing protein [Candidatus Omnitrophica bacterium]|nr:PDZ domain-containing protein [Candidatus Omnitrophota bacterium]